MLSEHLLCVRQSSRPEDDTNGNKLNSSPIINEETKMNKVCSSSKFYKHTNRVRWQWLGAHSRLGWLKPSMCKVASELTSEWYAKIWRQSIPGGRRGSSEAQRVALLRWELGSVWTELSDGGGEPDGVRLKRWMETVSFRALGPWPSSDVILRIMGSTSNPLAVLPSVPLKCIQSMTAAHPYTNSSFNQKMSGSNAAKTKQTFRLCAEWIVERWV